MICNEQSINTGSTSSLPNPSISISKTQLAKKLDVSRNTLLRFHNKFALELIPDYFDSFPKLNDETRFDLPLSEYQAWVLSKLIRTYLNTPTFLIEVDLSKENVIESYDYQSFLFVNKGVN